MKQILYLLSFWLFLGSPRAAATVSFSAPVNYPVGTAPVAVVVGDFNGDGKLDLAVANSSSNDVSILLGNGDGTFQAAVNYSVGQAPTFLTAGDFNGDHRLDLAVAIGSQNSVRILLGNGDGTLQPEGQYNAGTAVEYIASADFNDDNKPDLLASNRQGVISILLGNGDGTFQSATITSTDGNTAFVAVGDFDRDGAMDVATGNGGVGLSEKAFGKLIVLLGNGDGTFQAAATEDLGFWPRGVLTQADLNGDGKIDLVAAVEEGIFVVDIRVLLGHGDGTFSVGQPVKGMFSDFVTVADANNDHNPDLIALEHFAPQTFPIGIQIMPGNGDGSFQDVVANPCAQSGGCVQLSTQPSWLAVGDFDGSKRMSFAVTNLVENTVSVLLNLNALKSDFSLSASALTPAVVAAGQSATGAVTISRSGGFNSAVSFTCSLQPVLPHAPTCALTPNASGASLVVTTTAPNIARAVPVHWSYALWLPLVGLVGAGASLTSRGQRKILLQLSWCTLFVSVVTLELGCGGNSVQAQQFNNGTPPGSYTISVTGTAGALQRSTGFTLTVQ